MDFFASRSLRGTLLSMTAVIALLPAGAAFAQDAAPAEATNEADIIVTAQRRAERLIDVPVSVSAVSGESLEDAGVTSSRELSMVVPGLRVEASGAYVQPTIRGISTSVISPTAEANIATYIDGVYQSTMVGAVYDLPDIRQVEVLKGPQGTLFGRNATGGAILINTVQPDLAAATGMMATSYGRFDDLMFRSYVTVPLVEDRLAIGVSGLYQNSGGYKRNIITGRMVGDVETVLVRGKIRFRPWDGADFVLTGLYVDRKDEGAVKNTNYLGNNAARATLPASQIASRPWEFAGNEDPVANSKQTSVSLRGEIEVGPGALTTTTAYTDNENLLTSDSDNSPLAGSYIEVPGFNESFQQELIYATNQVGPVRAVAGLFYYYSDGGQNLNVNRNLQAIFQRDKAESYAAFGELTFDISDRLNVTGGLRYSRDKQRAFAAFVAGTGIQPAVIPMLGERTWDSWTPRVSVLFKATDRTNLYFTYSQGFKAGLFNTVSLQPTPVNPEKVKAFEAGIKSNEVQNLSLSLAGFYYDYKDLQQPTIVSTNNVPRQELRNAASSEIYGAEFTMAWNPIEAFTLSGGATWLHARYLSYPTAVINIPTGTGGNRQITADVSGNTLIRSPDFSANISARYVLDTEAGEFDATGTLFYSSKFFIESGNRVVQPDYALVNASVGFRPAGTGMEIRVWGKNLTNRAVIYGSNILPAGDSINHAPPRTYGLEASYRF
jgi:iron complex outermembrane recepter protein